MMMRRLPTTAALLSALLLAAPAWACSVCGQAQENSREAYLWGTMLLSLLPLGLLGGVVGFVVFKVRRAEAAELAASLPPKAAPDAL